jgi:hypothetical protein
MTTKFKDLNITTTINHFSGDKISINRVLNKPIIIHEYKIETSKFTDQCLHMQIEVDGAKRVLFLGSKILIDTIEKVPKDKFPVETIIIKDNNYYEFT